MIISPLNSFVRTRYVTACGVAGFVGIAGLLVSFASNARDIHYGAVVDEQLAICDAQHWRGQVEESASCYRDLIVGESRSGIKAEAAWALNDLQGANRWFQQATLESPDDVATLRRWGDLYAASHQDAEAMKLYREALALQANDAFANLGAARLLVGGFDDAASIYLEPLLSDATRDDGARVGAWLLVARMALENSNFAEAVTALATAEEIINQHDWPPLELYALRAASDLLQNTVGEDWTAMSLAYNPHYGDIHAIPAHFYVITRRYREAIDKYQMAVDIEPGLAAAHEALGVNLLRDNQMSRARKHLETAHDEDPFSPRAVNTLRLLDSFVNFRLLNDPVVPTADKVVPITLRLHKDEADVIGPYAIDLTRASIDEFTQRFGFELAETVVIEMYPDHDDFAVRTAGMPGIGILGAAFGYVIAMDSPSARPAEQFQWGTTLWHEIAHIFTLEGSDHLVPRWFSEGASVFEEWRSGPNPGVHIPMSVYAAMRDDLFLPVAKLDEGFLRPTYEDQIIVSYMQAGLVCQFIDRHYGETKLSELLNAYKNGLQTTAAIEQVLQISATGFDSEFAEFVQAEYGLILSKLDDWHAAQLEVAQLIAAQDWQGAIELTHELLEWLPQYVQPDSPYLALARAEDELGNSGNATAALEKFWQKGGFLPIALQDLAQRFADTGRNDDAIRVLQSSNLVDPFDMELHGALGELLLKQKRPAEALAEFKVALALKPHDIAVAHYRLATAYHDLGERAATQNHLLQALDVAPNYRPAQRLLLAMMTTETAN